MRRKDREVKEKDEILGIIQRCLICRLGLVDTDGKPYIVPLNFGYLDDEQLTFFFHSAKSGRKIEVLRENPFVAFEMDCDHRVISAETACGHSFDYQSVMGLGKVEFVAEPDEKLKGLQAIMRHTAGLQEAEFTERDLDRVLVLKLTVTEISAKRHLTA